MSYPAALPEPGWHPDPAGRYQYRYWDGDRWTEDVATDGAAATDPDGAAQDSDEAMAPPRPVGPPQQSGDPPILASKWLRVGAYLLDNVLISATFWFGWFIWSVIIYDRGQTPAKLILRMRVIDTAERRAVTRRQMAYRELVLKGPLIGVVLLVAAVAAKSAALLVACYAAGGLWWVANCVHLLADRRNRAIWDRMQGAAVIKDPGGRFDPRRDPRRDNGSVPAW